MTKAKVKKPSQGFRLEPEVMEKVDEIGRKKFRIETGGKRTQVIRMIISEAWDRMEEEE